eukprot:TRINITY_DN45635_c0_g1_i1.p1 TRINITY_DN45635_c0_g1~~TRINITY_DN45635_c0_g1_i1.p1  ORF type:complete len:108 (-),score=4.66 TRINITY_DN45635_c0_g1_i1:61-384(-)
MAPWLQDQLSTVAQRMIEDHEEELVTANDLPRRVAGMCHLLPLLCSSSAGHRTLWKRIILCPIYLNLRFSMSGSRPTHFVSWSFSLNNSFRLGQELKHGHCGCTPLR